MTRRPGFPARGARPAPSEAAACPVCGGWRVRPLETGLSPPAVPELLHGDASAARAAPRRPVVFVFCAACGHLFPDAATGSAPMDDPAPADPGRASRLAALARRYQLAGLNAGVIAATPAEAAPAIAALEAAGLAEVGRLAPDSRDDGPERELFVCRDALAGSARPGDLLYRLKAASRRPRDTLYYFELPDAGWLLGLSGAWALAEHAGAAFSAGSLRRLLGKAGFELLALEAVDGGRRRAATARAAAEPGDAGASRDEARELEHLGRLAEALPARLARSGDRLRALQAAAGRDGGRLVVWGAGLRAAVLCDLLKDGTAGAMLIDARAERQGRFLAGGGLEVRPPEALEDQAVAALVVTEPAQAAAAGRILAARRTAGPRPRGLLWP